MDAESIRALIKGKLEKLGNWRMEMDEKHESSDLHSPSWNSSLNWLMKYEHTINALQAILDDITEAEAAEQESIKALPLCNKERGALVADRIDPCPWYNPLFCSYYRELDLKSTWLKDVARCACPTDEPAADSESVLTTKKAIRVLDTRTFEERFEEIEKSYWKRMEQTVKRLNELEINAINVGMLEARINSRIDTLEATDTAFSDTLKGYLERLEKIDKELGIHMHYHAAMRRKQADEQPEEAEPEEPLRDRLIREGKMPYIEQRVEMVEEVTEGLLESFNELEKRLCSHLKMHVEVEK